MGNKQNGEILTGGGRDSSGGKQQDFRWAALASPAEEINQREGKLHWGRCSWQLATDPCSSRRNHDGGEQDCRRNEEKGDRERCFRREIFTAADRRRRGMTRSPEEERCCSSEMSEEETTGRMRRQGLLSGRTREEETGGEAGKRV